MPTTTEIDRATLVHIAVWMDGPDHKIGMFPKRRGDTAVFFTRPAQLAKMSTVKPREVLWMADGFDKLPQGCSVRIKAKNPGPSPFRSNDVSFTLTEARNTAHSGWAKELAQGHAEATWSYDIDLLDATGTRLTGIDPDVIVKEDP